MVWIEYSLFICNLIIFIILLDNPSPAFKKFLTLLGDEIELKGWKKFRGGLDAAGYYFTFLNFEYIVNLFCI